ncbi:MAG: hypothetical protein ACE5JR_06065 [Gemmatimonadota bacterium]
MPAEPNEQLPRREHGFSEAIRHGTRAALVRDFIIFEVKLFLDGLKDVVMSQIALLALLWDLISGERGGRRFYAVLRHTERLDLWLNLYGAARKAERSGEGLFEVSTAGSDTLLGKLEQMTIEVTTEGDRELRRRLAGRLSGVCRDPNIGVGNFLLHRNAFRVVRRWDDGSFELLVEIPVAWLDEERMEEVDAALAPFCS